MTMFVKLVMYLGKQFYEKIVACNSEGQQNRMPNIKYYLI